MRTRWVGGAALLPQADSGNRLAEAGACGNFDSVGGASLPRVAVPPIPLAWPTGAGFSDDHLYIADTYARRVVRLDKTYALDALCDVK